MKNVPRSRQLSGEQPKNRAAVSALKPSSSMKIPNNQCSRSITDNFLIHYQHLPTTEIYQLLFVLPYSSHLLLMLEYMGSLHLS